MSNKQEQQGQLCDSLYSTNPVCDVIKDIEFDRHLRKLSRKMDLGLPIHDSDMKYAMRPALEAELRWLSGDSKLRFSQDKKIEDEDFE